MKPSENHRALLTRRSALGLLVGSASILSARPALAETEEELRAKADQTTAQIDETQKQYDATKKQLDALAAEVQQLSIEQAKTLDQIYDTEKDINDTQKKIDKDTKDIKQREKDLAQKQERLSRRVSSAYKSGGNNILSILLSSDSFEQLESNIYYLDKISEADAQLISDIKQAKAELEQHRVELEDQEAKLEEHKSDLQALNERQQEQINDLHAKQDEVSELLKGLDSKVKELLAKRDAELLAADREAERARSLAAASAASSSSYTRIDPTALVQGATGSQKAVLNACSTTPSPGAGLCAWWVEDVFENAGIGSWGGNACDLYNQYCYLSDQSLAKPGMIVAVSTYPTGGLGAIYGHVGIYIGNGLVMENIGYINTRTLAGWVQDYSGYVTPRWGWMGGVALA